MSQIIKLQDGNKMPSTEPKVFEWKDIGKYNLDDIVSNGYKNVDTYIQNNNLSGDKANSFRNSTNKVLTLLKEGKLQMNSDGSFTDLTGSLASTGKFDKGLFGGAKDTDNNANIHSANYLKELIGGMQKYTPKVAEDYKLDIEKGLANKHLGGNWDENGWAALDTADKSGKMSTKGRTAALSSFLEEQANAIFNNPNFSKEHNLNKDVFKSPEDLANKLKTLAYEIKTGYGPKSKQLAYSAGLGDLGKYFGIVEQKPLSPEEQKAADDNKAVEEHNKSIIQEQADAEAKVKAKNDYFLNIAKHNLGKEASFKLPALPVGSQLGGYNYKGLHDYIAKNFKGKEEQYWGSKFVKFNPSNLNDLSNNLDAYHRAHGKKLAKQGYQDASGGIFIPESEDTTNFTIGYYNPNTREYKRVPIQKSPRRAAYEKAYEDSLQSNVAVWANGGAVAPKVYIPKSANVSNTEWSPTSETIEKQTEKATGLSKSDSRLVTGKNSKLSGTDIARLAAIGMDLSGVIAGVSGFSPVGAGLGVAGTVTNFGADVAEDGFDLGDVKNLGLGLGADALSLVPWAGMASGAGKVTKGLIKAAPLLISAWSAYENTGPALKAISKLTSGQDLNVADYRAIANGIGLLTGAASGVTNKVQSKSFKKGTATGNSLVETANGNVSVSPEQLTMLKKAKGLAAQNEYLKTIHPEAELGKQFGVGLKPNTWKSPNVSPEFNINVAPTKTVKRFDVNGNIVESQMPLNTGMMSFVNPKWMQKADSMFDNLGIRLNTARHGKAPAPIVEAPKPKVKRVKKPIPIPKKGSKVYEGMRNKTPKQAETKFDENGQGLLFKSGGILKAKGGAQTPRIMAKNTVFRTPFLNDYATQILNDIHSSGLSPEDYVNSSNAYEDKYDTLTKSNNYFSGTPTYAKSLNVNEDVRGLQQEFAKLHPFMRNSLRKGIQGYGNTEKDGTVFDGILGDRTFNSTIGRGVDDSHVALFNEQLKDKGIEYFKDPNHGGYRMRMLQPSQPTQLTKTEGSNLTGNTEVPKSFGSKLKGALGKINIDKTDASEFSRMLGGLQTNIKAAEQYKSGLKPSLGDTSESYVPVQGNYFGKSVAHNQAADLLNQTSIPITSDASLQSARMLEANNKANALKLQGDQSDIEAFQTSRGLAQQYSDKGKADRVAMANQNNAQVNAITAAKGQIDSGLTSANYQGVIAPYMIGKEQQWNNNKLKLQSLDLQDGQQQLKMKYSPLYDNLSKEMSQLEQQYSNWNPKLGLRPTNFNDWDSVKDVTNRYSKLGNDYATDASKLQRNILLGGKQFIPKAVKAYSYNAKGGTLSPVDKVIIESNKLNSKNTIADKNNHNKLLVNLSGSVLALIKKGMQCK